MRSLLSALLHRLYRPRQATNKYSANSTASSSSSSSSSSPFMSTTTRTLSSSGATALLAYACSVSSPAALAAVPDDTDHKPHHLKHGKGFKNPWASYHNFTAPSIGAALLWRKITGRLVMPDTTPPTVTVTKPSFLPTRTDASWTSLRATWLGHACYYLEFPNGLRVLFDPVFEERCSPFTWLGPKRYTPIPCQLDDIPIVDVVIISHSHYDHLSHPSVLQLAAKHPHALFAVPLGLEKWFGESGVKNVVELDWWQDVDIVLSPLAEGEKRVSVSSSAAPVASDPVIPAPADDSTITARISCLPCQHTSARGPLDRNSTLWASWAVRTPTKSVWFGGDTGYRSVPELPTGTDDYSPAYEHLPRCPAFSQIGELRGPFDLGLIPIGAYDPRFVMSPVHANPFDSVEIFKATKCVKAMGIHWGTWALTIEEVLEPPVLLKEALRRSKIDEVGVFDVCDIGESREF